MRATGARRFGVRFRSGALLAAVGIAAATEVAAVAPPALIGWLRASGGSIDSAPSFLDGGYGKLVDGALPSEARADGLLGELRLAMDWEPGVGWRLFVHATGRVESGRSDHGAASGLLEAFVERRFGFGEGHEVVLRLGQFFLPSSRENVEPLWASPYTLTLSALNSWVAEEIRPIGLDASWSRTAQDGQRWSLAGTVFGGNDTAGTLIAWRGFAFHDRPTPTGELLPLPLLADLGTTFPLQDPRGTLAIGDDLDGRPGVAGRARWDAPGERGLVQASAFFNNGDRALHDGQYAWRTGFRSLSVEVELPGDLRLLGEWGSGTSEMGFAPPGARSRSEVDVAFDLYYVMLSRAFGPVRASLRYDDFDVEDRDSHAGDSNDEVGSAWTLALVGTVGERWRVALEGSLLDADRPIAALAGAPGLDATSIRAELRVAF